MRRCSPAIDRSRAIGWLRVIGRDLIAPSRLDRTRVASRVSRPPDAGDRRREWNVRLAPGDPGRLVRTAGVVRRVCRTGRGVLGFTHGSLLTGFRGTTEGVAAVVAPS